MSQFSSSLIKIFLDRGLSKLEENNNFEPAFIEAYRYSPFQKTSFIRNNLFYHSLPHGVPNILSWRTGDNQS